MLPVLEDVIDPPDLSHAQPAFDQLHRMNFIDMPDDDGELTEEGQIAARLGIDLILSKLVLNGVRLGVGREAVAMAAALSMQQTPFRRTSPYVHCAAEMHEILSLTMRGQDFFDAGLYSGPLMLLRVRWRGGS